MEYLSRSNYTEAELVHEKLKIVFEGTGAPAGVPASVPAGVPAGLPAGVPAGER